MSQVNCDACNDLRETSPEFVQNGVTETIATSLKNNTGLNPALTVLHDNCEDLNNINDCLIGRMDDELEAYDVCDWKAFMHKFLPNNYETLKAIIAGDCGQWTRMDDLCYLIRSIVTPPIGRYGVIPTTSYPAPATPVGQLVTANITQQSIPAMNVDGGLTERQCFGIRYARREINDCETGTCELFEWLGICYYQPDLHDIQVGSVVWHATKDEILNTVGWSQYLWDTFSVSSLDFVDCLMNDGRFARWLLLVDTRNHPVYPDRSYGYPNELCIIYQGSTYPNGASGNQRTRSNFGNDGIAVFRSPCVES